ncbi:MAG: hypothetical protein AB9846_17850 [Tenuifilaceae bacterium]
MKNQYFGDTRDLFKYDLIFNIIEELGVRNFIFIPMLTKDDNSTDGSKIDYSLAKAGYLNMKLSSYLKEVISSKKREIGHIKTYYSNNNINAIIIEQVLIKQNRSKYFEDAISFIQPNSLIFIDPDNGIEVKNSTEKHLLFSELKSVTEKMDNQSILMIYQHFSRENHVTFINRKLFELQTITKQKPLYITDNQIVFFFLTKDETLTKELELALTKYKNIYKKLVIDVKSITNNQKKIVFN